MRILFIKPSWFRNSIYADCVFTKVPPLNFGILAALSGSHDVKIADEDVEDIPFSEQWDLVAISVATMTAVESYQIAGRFRTMRVKVVLGGVHISLLQSEALQHADSLVIGEAERVWPALLSDFPKLKSTYYDPEPVDMDTVPIPRRDLFYQKYRAAPLQITRGCIHSCRYCYLQKVPWKKYRMRDPKLVAEEVAKISKKYLFVVDDNMYIDRAYVMKVASHLAPLKKFWWSQAPVSIGEDLEMLDALRESGMFGVSLGIDTVIKKSYQSVSKKSLEIEKLRQVVHNFHKRGIGVVVLLVLGFDNDHKDVFKYSIDVMKEINMDAGVFSVLTPFPGTDFYQELEQQGRILTKDWSRYDSLRTVFQPKNMTAQELEDGVHKLFKEMTKMRLRNFYQTIPHVIRFIMRSPQLAFYLKDYIFMRPRSK
ncbi:MAG: radical SAM protein [Candidatus Omnitrophica bacterium]|nr:radical SAM protein [Candidatus Omnitrophota bacterium]